MTDSHAQLEAWLVDGAMGNPPREIAVHATLCESCNAALGAFDALALIDVAAAGSPPLLAAPTRLRKGVAWARLATAVVGTMVAGILVVLGVSQLLGLGGPAGGPAGGPEGTELAGLSNSSDGAGPAQSRQTSGGDSTPAEAPIASGFETPLPGVTPGPLPYVPPVATPRPPAPGPSVTAAPTPAPPTFSPSPIPEPTPTAMPTPAPTTPSSPLGLTASGTGPVVLNWSPPADDGGSAITGYEIWRGTASGTETPYETSGPTPDYTDNGALSAGETYYYVVKAINGVGTGPPSNEASVGPI